MQLSSLSSTSWVPGYVLQTLRHPHPVTALGVPTLGPFRPHSYASATCCPGGAAQWQAHGEEGGGGALPSCTGGPPGPSSPAGG